MLDIPSLIRHSTDILMNLSVYRHSTDILMNLSVYIQYIYTYVLYIDEYSSVLSVVRDGMSSIRTIHVHIYVYV